MASFAVARWIPKRAVSSRLVVFADFFIPVLTMCLVCVVAAVATAGWGLYFVPFLLSALVLMTRAALVPSTPQRTTCLEKSSDKRPAGAEALQEALARCAEHSPWSTEDARAFWSEHRKSWGS
jgi:hypothetical protein